MESFVKDEIFLYMDKHNVGAAEALKAFGFDEPGSLTPNQKIERGFKNFRKIVGEHNRLMNLQSSGLDMGSPFESLNGGNVDFNSMNRPQNYTIQFGDVITNATAEDIGQEIAWQVRTL